MKIAKDTTKRQYELSYLVPTVYSSSEVENIKQEVLALVKKYKGKVISEEEWGKKELAYTIKQAGKKYQEAYYFHLLIEFLPTQTQAFEKFLYLNHQVIRHLLVIKKEEEQKESNT